MAVEAQTCGFLGTGWSFPPQFVPAGGGPDESSGRVVMTGDEADIAASLRILFGTARGERFLQPQYGLDMQEYLFDAMSTTMQTYLEDRIKRAILIYEPRVKLAAPLRVDVDRDGDGRLYVEVDYEVQRTNSRYNLVFPFYYVDGNEVRPRQVSAAATALLEPSGV